MAKIRAIVQACLDMGVELRVPNAVLQRPPPPSSYELFPYQG
ncbi:MAG: hypothetical protein ABW032_12285 [Burkholderiaceae bacterium]